MLTRRPDIAVGILALAVSAIVNLMDRYGWATLLSWALVGMTIRFVTLPGDHAAPNRRTGSLLTMPFILGLFLVLLGDGFDAKARTDAHGAALGTILLSSWVVLAVWDTRRNRRLDREEAMMAAADAEAASR